MANDHRRIAFLLMKEIEYDRWQRENLLGLKKSFFKRQNFSNKQLCTQSKSSYWTSFPLSLFRPGLYSFFYLALSNTLPDWGNSVSDSSSFSSSVFSISSWFRFRLPNVKGQVWKKNQFSAKSFKYNLIAYYYILKIFITI